MSAAENKELVRRMYGLLNQGELDACYELFAPRYVYHHINGDLAFSAAKQHEVEWFTVFPDAHVTIEDMVAEDDKVAVRVTWTGTHLGPGFGWTPGGNALNITNANTFRIAENRIVELWNVCDLRLLQQISIPTPAGRQQASSKGG